MVSNFKVGKTGKSTVQWQWSIDMEFDFPRIKKYPQYIGHFFLEFFYSSEKKIQWKMTNIFRVLLALNRLWNDHHNPVQYVLSLHQSSASTEKKKTSFNFHVEEILDFPCTVNSRFKKDLKWQIQIHKAFFSDDRIHYINLS